MRSMLLPIITCSIALVYGCNEGNAATTKEKVAKNEITEIVQETTTAEISEDTAVLTLVNEVSEPMNEIKPEPMKPTTVDKTEETLELTTPVLEEAPPVEVIEESTIVEPEQADTYNFHAYAELDALLKTYVSSSGRVNYAGIKKNKSKLDAIIKEFEANANHSGWSGTQKLTYWINAYNAYTIKLIVDNYPTSSITKITAKPWDKQFIKLGGKTYTLNNIENDIIRKRFNEPRIHFALNCASKSCPVLLNRAYTPSKLYGQLTSQTKRFMKDTSKNQLSGKSIKISKIFDWYKADFTKNGNTVLKFIKKYYSGPMDDNPTVGYSDYSWDLNK